MGREAGAENTMRERGCKCCALGGSFRGRRHSRGRVATSLQALVADLLHGGAIAGFAAGVLDAERGAVLAAGLVLMIDGRAGGRDRRAAVAEIEDVFDDRVA